MGNLGLGEGSLWVGEIVGGGLSPAPPLFGGLTPPNPPNGGVGGWQGALRIAGSGGLGRRLGRVRGVGMRVGGC